MAEHPLDPDDDLEQIRALARDVGTDPVVVVAPPADLWTRLEASTVTPDQPGDLPDDPSTAAPTELRPRAERSTGRPTVAPWLLAAAAVLVVVLGGIAMFSLSNRAEEIASPTVIAETELEPLADINAGTATLIDEDGVLRVKVLTAPIEVDDDSFAEVWMINPDVTELISLGPLREDGIYEVPPGVDPAAFPVIDVSVEPIDGDPTHSGNSVLRGILSL